MRSHEEIADQAVFHILETLKLPTPTEPERARVRRIVLRALNHEASIANEIVRNSSASSMRDSLLDRVNVELLARALDGERETENTDTPFWQEWQPGLDNDHLSMAEVLGKLPGVGAEHVPFLVWLFENPDSPIAMRGSVTLERHDMIHVLVGRGLIDQDEAFVLGYTMGATRNLTRVEKWFFKRMLERYPEPYKIFGEELKAYDLGVEAGERCGAVRLYDEPIEDFRDDNIGEIRARYGIDTQILRDFYRKEQRAIPKTYASARLPV
jgi:hypothetical protein